MNTKKLIELILNEDPEFNGNIVISISNGRIELNSIRIDKEKEIEEEQEWKKAA